MIEGRCVSWDDEQGWGVLAGEGAPREVWAHFSNVEMSGYRFLRAGDPVSFTWQPAPGGDQDGYAYRAVRVLPIGRS